MKQHLKKVGIGVAVLLLAIQFFHPARNVSPGPWEHDITTVHAVPDDVKSILEAACYDCHSNNTRYPWYANVQPVAWLLAHDVDEGKAELNFSEFGSYPPKRAAHKLEEVAEEVEEGHMPIRSYKLTHPEARLTPEQVTRLKEWALTTRKTIVVEGQ